MLVLQHFKNKRMVRSLGASNGIAFLIIICLDYKVGVCESFVSITCRESVSGFID